MLEQKVQVLWPNVPFKYRAVQAILGDTHYLIFNMHLSHNSIICSFLLNNGITPQTAGDGLVNLKGRNYKIVGMGYCDINPLSSNFEGDSAVYNVGLNKEELKLLSEKYPERPITFYGSKLK